SVTPNLSFGGEVFWAGQYWKSGIGYAARDNMDKMGMVREPQLLQLKPGCDAAVAAKTINPRYGNKFKGGIYMVFEYMDHDLTGLADRPGLRFTVPQIKCYMKQLLTGLHYCHVNQVLRRDIKGSNLLIDNEGNLKLADFGLARSVSTDHTGNLTNRVITLWYRPPEFLLGATKYGPAVDMWSVGCIFAELLNGKPILPGKNELELYKSRHNLFCTARAIKSELPCMRGVECQLLVKEELLLVMGLALQIIPKVVNLEVQLVVEVQTRWVVTVINSMVVGSNNS
ncbi:hypothetical protein SO802_023749, partial [Lithocarpus litseifolius]